MRFDYAVLSLMNLFAQSKRFINDEVEDGELPQRKPKPIPYSSWPDRFPAKEHCSRCGLCETSFVSEVATSCSFIGEGMSKIDYMEKLFHERGREMNDQNHMNTPDELRFGVQYKPMMLAKGNLDGAQWTGVVTGIALSMMESGMVDAVVCIAGGETDKVNPYSWSEPRPIIAKTTDEILSSRGVKPVLAPSLAVLDDIKSDVSIRRLLFCGVGCAVQGRMADLF